MTEPDDLYTLRAQFWLGHYSLCVEEAKSIARRPMSPALKQEREEFLLRSLLALGSHDKVASAVGDSAIQALAFRAQYEQAVGNAAAQEAIVDKVKSLVASSPTTSVQLTAAHIFLQHGLTKEALSCVHLGSTMEHIVLSLQIYLKIDRLDLAKDSLQILKQADEDAVLTQLGTVYVYLATGESTAGKAIHLLQSMSEQYGPSPLLLNLLAASYLTTGNYSDAEARLDECQREFPDSTPADTWINMIVCYQHQGKPLGDLVQRLQEAYPTHPFCLGLERVEGAFEREAVKYMAA